ncbi:MAG: hypothetical protein MJ245_01400 [Clostridia bacterium]|nr:hypothetical protein [Clostridia bacterium]
MTLQAKIALERGLPIDAINISSFSIKKKAGKIPAYFDCSYDEVIRFNKKDLEEKFSKALSARGCELESIIFNDGAQGHVVLNVKIPMSMKEELNKPYGHAKFLGEIKGDVTGFYCCTFLNVSYV